MITKRHTYSYLYSITEFFFILMSLFSVLISLFLVYALINSFIKGEDVSASSFITFLGLLFAFAIWTPIVFLFMAYLMTDINVDEAGLHILFLWKKYSVKWDELLEIKPIRVLGVFINKKASVIVVNSKLPFVYRIYGLLHSGVNQPVILVYRNISDYDILVRNISMQVQKNRRVRSKE